MDSVIGVLIIVVAVIASISELILKTAKKSKSNNNSTQNRPKPRPNNVTPTASKNKEIAVKPNNTRPTNQRPLHTNTMNNNNINKNNATQTRGMSAKQTQGQNLINTVQQVSAKKQTSKEEHIHAEEAMLRGKEVPVKEEIVEYGGSLGGISTEGCREHYNKRYVMQVPKLKNNSGELDEIQKIIVMGEVLNNPRFKSRRTH